ncbi:MAG: TolC family protein [Phycisphaerales bacterium]|nr:TolC family protein [Phycisphaerales bacterium]
MPHHACSTSFSPSIPLARRLLTPGALLISAILVGCQSPLERDPEADLQASVRTAIDQQLRDLDPMASAQETRSLADNLETELDSRLDELEKLGPQASSGGAALALGAGLDGEPLTVVPISLENAIRTAVEHNLGVQRSRVDQAISAAEVVRAEAAFDAVLGAGVNFARIDEPSNNLLLEGPGGNPVIFDQGQDAKQWGFTTDVSKRLGSGGAVSVSLNTDETSIYNTKNTYQDAWNSSVNLGLSQPLLRGFGEDVNTAEIRIARNADRKSAVAIRGRLLDLLVQVENAYWNLVLARQDLVVAEWLVEEGDRIRVILSNRRGFDTTLAQYADAVATVESRKTRVIQARRDIGRAADALKVIINDPDLPVGGEFDLVPVDFMVDAPYGYDLRDSVATALAHSPSIDQAILDIDDASIREIVARNGRLPELDLRAEVSWLGLSDGFGSSVRKIDGDYIDYLVGLQFSQPIGNRAAESVLRQARLRRSGAVIGYRNSIQQVVFEVKDAIRDIAAGYALVGQARNFRLAQAENLRSLEALRVTLAALTPEFLNLLFQRQERLGEAQLQELRSLAVYNLAIAELGRATGNGLEINGINLVVVGPDATPVEVNSSGGS